MRTDPNKRKRTVSGNTVSNLVWRAFFGHQSQPPGPQVPVANSFYEFVPGDLFTPGAQNYVPLQKFETPIMPLWGHGAQLQNPGIMPFQGGSPLYTPFIPRTAGVWGTYGIGELPFPDPLLLANPDGSYSPPQSYQNPSSFLSDGGVAEFTATDYTQPFTTGNY